MVPFRAFMLSLLINTLLIACIIRSATAAARITSSDVSGSLISGTVSGSGSALNSDVSAGPVTTTSSSSTSTSTISVTVLEGTNQRTTEIAVSQTLNGTASFPATTVVITSTAPTPTNTQPCNQWVEFCTRGYGNITYVAAHNSPFVRKHNAAANQYLDVVTQLNDGIRMLQGQAHYVNDTLYYCHTSCDIFNAGTVESYLTTVVNWLHQNPFEVLTILIGNGDFTPIEEWVAPIENSGLKDIAYVPTNRSLTYKEWPTLAELILMGKRAVVFIDYKADEGKVPYMLDEFTYMFETPFSQTDRDFPCNIDRPPNQNTSEGKMYMANHNLNVELNFGSTSLLVPNTVDLNETNAVSGYGSLGLQANNCLAEWDRYPNFLLVDFYNVGNGSVFEVAAKANNVTYNRKCCGLVTSAGRIVFVPRSLTVAAMLISMVLAL